MLGFHKMKRFERRRTFFKWLAGIGFVLMATSVFLVITFGGAATISISLVGFVLCLLSIAWGWKNRDSLETGFWPYRGKWNEVAVPPAVAARRALCLAALVLRGQWEMELQALAGDSRDFVVPGKRKLAAELDRWLAEERLGASLTPEESRLLARPLGEWNESEIKSSLLRQDGLIALAWALHWVDSMPPYDSPVSPKEVLFYAEAARQAQERINPAELRPAREVVDEYIVALLWQLRLGLFVYGGVVGQEQVQSMELRKAYEEVLQVARRRGVLNDRTLNAQFFGPSFDAISVGDAPAVVARAGVRVHAFQWLFGEVENWDSGPGLMGIEHPTVQ